MRPEGRAFADMVRRHHADTLGFYGRDLGGRVIRKHLGWYMDRAGTPGALRREVLTAPPDRVPRLLDDALDRLPEAA